MRRPKTVLLIGTLDTKGEEVKYVKERIEARGHSVIVLDSGIRGEPLALSPDITREEVARAAGSDIETLRRLPRGPAIEEMRRGVREIAKRLYDEGRIDGVMALGGTDGSLLAAPAMHALPIGVPKLLVSPSFQGKETFGAFTGTRDVLMMHTVTDILGVNQISRTVFDNAVGAMVGMIEGGAGPASPSGRIVAVTMYGNTTPGVMMAKRMLEREGYEVVVFHPNGTGGRAMEEMAEQGLLTAVLDYTIHEVIDELFGGIHAAGPRRLEVAGEAGVPQVVVPGCCDFILWGPRETLPEKYRERMVYHFNPVNTLVKLSVEEAERAGDVIAEKLNRARGPVGVVLPLRGISMYDREGDLFYDPAVDEALFRGIKRNLRQGITVVEVDAHINDSETPESCVSLLLDLLGEERGG